MNIKTSILLVFLIINLFSPVYSQDTSLKKLNSGINKLDSVLAKDSIKNHTAADSSVSLVNQLEPPSVLDVISVGKVIWALIFFIGGLYLIRILTKILEVFAERSTGYRITIKGVVPIIRIFGWMLIIYIVIAGVFKPPVATVIAVTASVGIAVGFAAQDVIKNIFGGIMILFDRPFQVGDKIQLGEYYGEVIKIGLRSTRIVTADDSTVTIPNGELMNKSVSNSNYGEPNCQVVAEIFLPIEIDTDRVRQIATEAAQVSRYIYLNKPVTVLFFNEIKDRRAYLKMRLKAYVMDIRYEFQFKSDMTELVMKELLVQNLIHAEDFM
ncbi:MAG TPA: mechanosensitive ion channel domain-containing protein [Ignavibacteriaceae bacterium]|jgi:MscS family membrane protein|nr:mechanosensitive ion channel domain-containing protein [Ignavibacteriaceae bacterium]